MVMQDQARRLREPLPWGRPQKIVVAVLLSCLVLGGGTLLAFALTSGAPARADCISLSFPGTLGANDVRACGAQARRACASGAYRGIRTEMQQACARAGFPYRDAP
jgi:hypothetical protein